MHSSKLKLFLKLTIIFVSVFVFTLAGHGLYYICEQNNYDGCYQYKLKLLKEVPEDTKKAVFIGGSGVNFGISAEVFEEETGIRSINMGFSAGRSFDMYLESIKPYINDGDYVFISPELGYYSGDFHNVDSSSMMFCEYQNPDSLRILSFGDFVNYCRYTIENGWKGWYNSIQFGSKTFIQDVLHLRDYTIYDKWECNESGDFILHRNKEPASFETTKGDYILSSRAFIDDLNKYIDDWKKEVNFTPIIMFTPLDEDAVEDVEHLEKFVADIDAATDIPILFSAAESLYPPEYFFDTPLHLRYEYSRDVYTKMVVEAFNNYFIAS